MTNQTTNLRIGLLENCSHSLKRGYEMWSQWRNNDDAWLLKESVIWVHHGIELALKQLLVESNEFLVFQDVNKAVDRLGLLRKKKGMEDAGVLDLFEHDDKIMSVGFRNLVNRAAITLSISELVENAKLRKKIDSLAKYRNSMVHFSLELNIEEVSSLLSEILSPLLSMLETEIKDESFKKNDIPNIREIAKPLQKYIEQIRFENVNKAIRATHNALSPEESNRVGIIWQAQGSGLSLTLASYIDKLRQTTPKFNNHIFILVDRMELALQLHLFLNQEYDLNSHLLKNNSDLLSAIESESPEILVSSIQKFNFQEHITEKECLVICYNFHSVYKKIEAFFPNSLYLLFTGIPLNPIEKYFNVFGKLIGEYTFQQAVHDDIAKPIRLEKCSFISEGVTKYKPEEFENPVNVSLLKASNEYLISLAQHLTKHFDLRQKEAIGKGVIIVSNILETVTLYDQIIKIKPEWYGDLGSTGSIKSISSNESLAKRNFLLNRFRSEEDSLSLLITTASFLVGYDNPLIHSIYVTCPISHQLQYNIASLLSRNHKGKLNGLIVDYTELDWELEQIVKL